MRIMRVGLNTRNKGIELVLATFVQRYVFVFPFSKTNSAYNDHIYKFFAILETSFKLDFYFNFKMRL